MHHPRWKDSVAADWSILTPFFQRTHRQADKTWHRLSTIGYPKGGDRCEPQERQLMTQPSSRTTPSIYVSLAGLGSLVPQGIAGCSCKTRLSVSGIPLHVSAPLAQRTRRCPQPGHNQGCCLDGKCGGSRPFQKTGATYVMIPWRQTNRFKVCQNMLFSCHL